MVENSKNIFTVPNIKDFNLQETLDCGQCFRWEKDENNWYKGTVKGKTVSVKIEDNTLYIANANKDDYEKIWRDYFDLDLDYGKVRANLSAIDDKLKDASSYCPGIRILRQEPFEALCSFIISQNNNIPRIKGIIKKLCENFGEFNGLDYNFPTPTVMAEQTVESLGIIKSGFRAKYLVDAGTKIASGKVDLEKISKTTVEEARISLMQIKGVGPKVADCTMLYGMYKLECFPLDVWMKRAMAELFPTLEPADFGEFAGIAQQYIFHYSRMNTDIFKK